MARPVMIDNSRCATPATSSCNETLHMLYNAYLKLVSGTNTVQVQSSDFRRVEYGPGDLKALRATYNDLWDACGAGSGLPRLKVGGAQRGGPARMGC